MKSFTLKRSRVEGRRTHVIRRTCFPIGEELWVLRFGDTGSYKAPYFALLSLSKAMCWECNPKCNVLGTSHLYWIPSLQICRPIHLCSLSIAQLFPCYSSTKQIKKAIKALVNHLLEKLNST